MNQHETAAHVTIDVEPYAVTRPASRRGFVVPVILLSCGLLFIVINEGGRAAVPWHVGVTWTAFVALSAWLVFRPSERVPRMPRGVAILAALAPLAVLIQLIPIPIALLPLLSPGRAELVRGLTSVMATPSRVPLSIDPGTTLVALANVAACTLVFLLARDLAWRARPLRSWALVLPLVLIAGGEALLGVSQGAGDEQVLGTFRSRDHFAGFLEMTLPLTTAVGIGLIQRARLRFTPSAIGTLLGCAVLGVAGLLLAAIVQSLSKGGFIASVFGMVVAALLAVPQFVPEGGHRRTIRIAIVAAAVAGLFLLPTASLILRFADVVTGKAADARWSVLTDARQLLPLYPLFGSGFGTFGIAFLRYQTADVDLDFSFAHNDYLQLAAEGGLLGFVALAGLMAVLFFVSARAATRDRDWHTRMLGVGCAGSLAGIGLHSLFDFNMQIPANAMLLAWIAGIGASLVAAPSKGRPSRTFGLPQAAGVAIALLLLLYLPGRIVGDIRLQAAAAADTGGGVTSLAVAERAVRDEPASPFRWADLADALQAARQPDAALRSIDRAVTLAPDIPPVLLRAADFLAARGDIAPALRHSAHLLEKTAEYDNQVFEWTRIRHITTGDVLTHGLPADPRAARAYMNFMLFAEDAAGAAVVWPYLRERGLVDAAQVRDYVDFLDPLDPDAAVRTWTNYARTVEAAYGEREWLFNGDFENVPVGVQYDWHLEGDGENVVAAIDSTAAHTGTKSLRVRFGGKANVEFARTRQTTWLPAGDFVASGYVRTDALSTDRGVGLSVTGGEPRVVETEMLRGTSDWTPVSVPVHMSAAGPVTVAVVRRRSLKFDSDISGTAWIDSLRLTRALESRP